MVLIQIKMAINTEVLFIMLRLKAKAIKNLKIMFIKEIFIMDLGMAVAN